MQDYLVISLLDKDEDRVQSLLGMLNGFFRLKGSRIVLVASGSDIDRIAFEGRRVLPFTAFVSGIDSLLDATEKGESLIFYDTLGKDTYEITMDIMSKTNLQSLLTVGDDSGAMRRYASENSANVIRTLMVTAMGDRVFLYPPTVGKTRENVIDSLVQIDSITNDVHFSRSKPFALITDDGDGIDYSEIMIIAQHFGMALDLVPAKPLPRQKQYDAILAFTNPGYEPSLYIRFGYPFAYMNAPGQLPMAIRTALEAMKTFGAQ